MLERLLTTLDCVDVAFITDDMLDQLPAPARIGKTRGGGLDLNKPRIRTVLAAVLALAPSPTGFSVSELTAKITSMIAHSDRAYTRRQAAYDLKKLRAKGLIAKGQQVPTLHRSTPLAPSHRRPTYSSRAGHHAHPRRRPLAAHRPQTQDLDSRRPAL